MAKKRKLKKGVLPKLFVLVVIIALIIVGVNYGLKKIESLKYKEYTKSLNYMDTVIDIKLYSNNKEQAETALSEIERIYKYYHELTDRYNSYENINNIYKINNTRDITTLEINKDLYNIIDYGITWYYKSNGLFNINLGNLTSVWKSYRDNKNGVPSSYDLNRISGLDIKNIVIYDDYKILTGSVNLDLGGLAKGYATEVVRYYLNSIGLDRYLINAGGTVLAGKNSDTGKYSIGLQDPDNAAGILENLKLNVSDVVITSSGGYERFYEYEGVKYHHIINPNTRMPANNMKSVTVITKDAMLGDALSTTLFLMSIEDGKEFIKQFNDVEVIWYSNDNEIIKTNGVSKYE